MLHLLLLSAAGTAITKSVEYVSHRTMQDGESENDQTEDNKLFFLFNSLSNTEHFHGHG